MAAIQMTQFCFQYPGASAPCLQDICLSVPRGEFLLLCGYTGSGKSTLLRCLKHEVSPHGTRSGSIEILGRPIGQADPVDSAAQVGFVLQSPDSQIVMDTVWHELAFGLENLGLPPETIRCRVAETASFFGIESWFHQNVNDLSGGQRQILALASTMVLQPEILLLDEPTAQLDPIAAREFLQLVFRINQELGTTVLICEHRMEEVLPLAGSVVFLDAGRIAFWGEPQDFVGWVFSHHPAFSPALPAASQIAHAIGETSSLPITIRQGRSCLLQKPMRAASPPQPSSAPSAPPILSFSDLWFRYQKDAPFVLHQSSFALEQGETHAILGGNGSGKSTLLKLLCGALSPTRGKIRIQSPRSALLPQDVKSLFLYDTVLEDLMEWSGRAGYTQSQAEAFLAQFGLEECAHRHPYDLSGGQMQLVALIKLLLLSPDILFLDEPTKGMDAWMKQRIAAILKDLHRQGKTLVLVTHDLDFAACVAQRCSLLFDGDLISTALAKSFFLGNAHYTTAVNRVTRNIWPNMVTLEDIACHG